MTSFHDNQISRRMVIPATPRRRQRGQTAIIALLVLLLLSFVGALFITIVAGNLRTTGRANRTLNADYYAEAGIRYADDQLMNSISGADWRPPLQFQLADNTAATNSLNEYPAGQDPLDVIIGTGNRARTWYTNFVTAYGGTTFPVVNSNDPDKQYLEQGFARYDTEAGRFLIRVTYDPIHSNPADPSARYLKVESVGREGEVNAADPTTYNNQPPTRLAATLVAYVPIGITDYARFETNLDDRADVMNLGVPSGYYGGLPGGSSGPTTGASGSADNAPQGIITPGIFDFNLTSSTGGATGGTPNTTTPILQYPVVTTYGADNAYTYFSNGVTYPASILSGPNEPTGGTPVPGGGGIRANASLRLYGVNEAYLNRPGNVSYTGIFDDIEVAGNLLLDSYDPNASLDNTKPDTANSSGQSAALVVNPTPTTPGSGTYIAPSNAPASAVAGTNSAGGTFSTDQGAVRDGGSGQSSSDAAGYPRSVARLDPPVIDKVNSATSLTRYQDIAENSGARITTGINGGVPSDSSVTDPNAGQDGLGRAIYVNNFSDVQRDSSALVGGHTLVDEWINQTNGAETPVNAKNGWQGPFYNPPGVDITFGLQEATPANASTPYSFYGVRLTRSDADANGNPEYWKNTDGSSSTSETMVVPYHDLYASNDPTTETPTTINPDNDVVIYCEGNVRIKPSLLTAYPGETVGANQPPRLFQDNGSGTPLDDTVARHITVVTNGTAYIEGAILKGNPDTSLTILAKDYVCINTTQLYGGALADQNPQSTQPPAASVADTTVLDFGAENNVLVTDFMNPYGYIPGGAASAIGSANNDLSLYISGGPASPGTTRVDYDFVDPATGFSLNPQSGDTTPQPFDYPFVTAIFDSTSGILPQVGGDTSAAAPGGGTTLNPGVADSSPTLFQHITFDLSGGGNALLSAVPPGDPIQLWTRMDQNVSPVPAGVNVATQDYLQERSAVLPRDVVIQAVLYAQDKSFFVIPGPWFNTDSDDNVGTYASYLTKNESPVRPGIDGSAPNQARFPFNGQPVDLRIIVQGAVAENEPADISAQAAWMTKWGWIPECHGSNFTELSGHTPAAQNGSPSGPVTGLTLVYDAEAGYPYDPATTNSQTVGYIRTDIYGRPLPFTPDLPVSTGLLYAGQGDPQSLIQ